MMTVVPAYIDRFRKLMSPDNDGRSAQLLRFGRGTARNSITMLVASTGGMNVGAWIAGPSYGLVTLGIQLMLAALVLALIIALPEDRSNRLFRLARLLLNRGEHPAPPPEQHRKA